MNLFQLYMMFFGISTVIGVPLLSSFQVTQIKGSTWGDCLFYSFLRAQKYKYFWN